MARIDIAQKDADRLLAISTWNKFKGKTISEIITWILDNEDICEIIHSKK